MADIFDTIDSPVEGSTDIFDSVELDSIDIFDSIESDDPTLGEVGTGLVADIALAEGLKYAGAAGGTLAGGPLGTAIGYTGGAIVGGISGSIAAQKVEGRDDISWGRVVGDTLINFIPGSKLAKGGSFGARALKAGVKQGAMGSVIAPASQTVESIIDEGKIPTKEELGDMALKGGALGFGLGGASVGLEKLLGKVGGKTVDEVDDMIATGDLTFKDFKLLNELSTEASKKAPPPIPDTRGKGQQFHGTTADLSGGLSEGSYSSQNIYGQGLYTTDAMDIAKGYAGKGSGDNSVIYDISEKQPIKFMDLDRINAKDLAMSYDDDIIQEALEELPVNATATDLYDKMRKLPYPADEIQESFLLIQEKLESAGYGGIKHTGGKFTNQRPHNVKIYFDPKRQIDVRERMRFDVPELVQLKRKVKRLRAEGRPFGGDKLKAWANEINLANERIRQLEKPKPIMDGFLRRELEEAAARNSADIAATELINSHKSHKLASEGKGTLGKIFASLAPSKVVGRKSQQAAIDFRRNVDEAEEMGGRIERNLKKSIGDDAEVNKIVNGIIDGDLSYPLTKDQSQKLGSSLADVNKFLEMRRELQKKLLGLIDEGAYRNMDEAGRLAMREVVQDSITDKPYNRRSYRIFLDPKFQTDEKLELAAFNELSQKMGAKKAKDHMDRLQNASAATRESDPRNFSGAPVDSVLRRKHNPGEAERAWLGEIVDAPERMRETLSGLARTTARAEADFRIAQSLVEDGIATRTHAKGLDELVLRGTGSEGTGVYANPEVQVALNNIYLPNTDKGMENIVLGAMQDLYRASVAGSKASKVLLNTIAYPVQLYGNAASLIGMGINPFRGAMRGADLALAEFGGIEMLRKSPQARKKMLDDIQEMARYGIKNANILESDLRYTLDNGIFSKALGKVTDPLGKAYSVADTTGRYVGWKANQRTLRKLFPEASEEMIKREAAHLINDTYQNYDKLSNVVRTLSRWGVMPQFASFTAEFARNQYNQGKVIAQMLKGSYGAGGELGKVNTSAMRIEGAKRLTALTAVYGGTYGVIEGVKAASGLSQADQDAIRDLGYADYDKDKELMVKYNKETRKGWTANPSYIIPHSIGLSAFKAGMRGDDEASVIGMLSEEMIGEGSFIMQEAFRALSNKNKYGKDISNEMDELKNAADRIKYFIAESFRPGVSREFKKFAKAKRGAGDLTLAEVGQRQLGLRSNPFDINEQARFAIKKSYEPAKNEATAYYNSVKFGEPSPEEIAAKYEQAERINQESFSSLVQNRRSMSQLGFTEDEIVKTMKDAGVPSNRIIMVMDGTYAPLPRVKLPSVSESYEALEGSEVQKRQQIIKIAQADRELGKSLMNRWKREQRKTNLSERDQLFKNLDTREKVSYLSENRGKIEYYRKKGLVSDSVLKALQ